ncbi:hypothetical protein [Halohasta litorea]|uniref:Uncharacterized protein n=1 Tax=Halohasta litorea TaxID=869891 RepID=A0ABD6D9M7_9EURY|nr:hypothetical protein [Halohasta litorea]
MTFRHGAHRADAEPGKDPHDDPPNGDADCDGTDNGSPRLTADQRREWRRWIVEMFLTADYGVVPVDHLVDVLVEREPEAIDRSICRTVLTERLLPRLARESVLEYDADRELLINYGE